jgi:hypothetical protein
MPNPDLSDFKSLAISKFQDIEHGAEIPGALISDKFWLEIFAIMAALGLSPRKPD